MKESSQVYRGACCPKCDWSKDRWTPNCANPNCECHTPQAISTERRFDCFDEDCGKCSICEYLAFIEYAEGCAPGGSTIERNPVIENYLKEKPLYLEQEKQRAVEEIVKKVEDIIAEFGDQGIECVSSILDDWFHGGVEVEY